MGRVFWPLPLSFPSLIYTRYSCFSFLTTQWQYITHCYCYVHQSVKLRNIYLICLSMILKLILPKCTSNVCLRQLIGWRSLKTVKSTQQKLVILTAFLINIFFLDFQFNIRISFTSIRSLTHKTILILGEPTMNKESISCRVYIALNAHCRNHLCYLILLNAQLRFQDNSSLHS